MSRVESRLPEEMIQWYDRNNSIIVYFHPLLCTWTHKTSRSFAFLVIRWKGAKSQFESCHSSVIKFVSESTKRCGIFLFILFCHFCRYSYKFGKFFLLFRKKIFYSFSASMIYLVSTLNRFQGLFGSLLSIFTQPAFSLFLIFGNYCMP